MMIMIMMQMPPIMRLSFMFFHHMALRSLVEPFLNWLAWFCRSSVASPPRDAVSQPHTARGHAHERGERLRAAATPTPRACAAVPVLFCSWSRRSPRSMTFSMLLCITATTSSTCCCTCFTLSLPPGAGPAGPEPDLFFFFGGGTEACGVFFLKVPDAREGTGGRGAGAMPT